MIGITGMDKGHTMQEFVPFKRQYVLFGFPQMTLLLKGRLEDANKLLILIELFN